MPMTIAAPLLVSFEPAIIREWETLVMHHLNTSGNLSPTEFASLRHVANGLINTVPNDHRNLLIAMRLACFDGRRGLVLTDLGWRQLERADPATWCAVPPMSSFSRQIEK
jgi:hypothetical protein